MAKIHVQHAVDVLSWSGSLAGNDLLSGSLACAGYGRLVGAFRGGSSIAACGLRIDQSIDSGSNWDITSASDAMGVDASAACSTNIVGNYVRVRYQHGATAGSARFRFYLIPV